WALREFLSQHTILRDLEKNVFCSHCARNRTLRDIARHCDWQTVDSKTTEPERFMCSAACEFHHVSSVGDEGFKRLPDVRANDEIGHVVEIGRVAVEKNKARPTPLRQQRKTRCRPYHQRRADSEKQIAGARKRFGALHGRFRHGLTKRDCCGLDVAAAIVAVGCTVIGDETLLDPGKLITPTAIKARGIGGIAM